MEQVAQVRIAEGDNTAQYWRNLGSQESAIVIGPVSLFASVKCWADDGGLFRLFKFTDLAQYRPYTKPIVSFTMASSSESRRARVGFMDGTLLGHISLLPRQTILEVRKLELGTALARCFAENKCWRPAFGPALAAKYIPELSFQQRHDIGSRSSANFWRCWASVGPYLISHLGDHMDMINMVIMLSVNFCPCKIRYQVKNL